MADIVTRRELEDAKVDAKDLGEATNEKTIVNPRYGDPYKSLPFLSEEVQLSINEWGEAIQLITQDDGVPALAVSDASGQTQQQINDYVGSNWRARPGGYNIGDKARLLNGLVVVSTTVGNTNNPNTSMTGWIPDNDASRVFDKTGVTQQVINDRVKVIKDAAIIFDEYKPAYSTATLATRFSTLAEAKAVYPAAMNLTDRIDRTALQQAINDANGRTIVLPAGRDIYLNSVGPSPEGHDGQYCLVGNNSFTMIGDSGRKPRLIVPANTHGIVGLADDIEVNNIHFFGDNPPNADIGHMIKFSRVRRPKVLNCEFTNVADVAVNFGYHYTQATAAMDIAIANGQLATFDMYQYGCSDFEYSGNKVNDCYGDGGLEIQGSVRGKIKGNDHRNCRYHGYRIVGCKDTDIYNNHGADIGTTATFSAMLSLFSGALTRNGNIAWMYNEDLRVYGNTGENVKDSIHIGLGSLNCSVFDNDIGAWNRGLYIFHTNPTCRYGLKDSRIYRNKLRSAKGKLQVYGAHLAVGTAAAKPLQGALLDNVDITDNEFDFSIRGIYTEDQTIDHKIQNSVIKNRYKTQTSTSPASSALGFSLGYVESSDLSGNISNVTNGTELVVTNPSGDNKYGQRDELKFTTSGDTLVMQSRADLKTGQTVRVRANAGSTLPAPLSANSVYYLIAVDSKTFKLASSIENAISGTAITITGSTVFHNYLYFI